MSERILILEDDENLRELLQDTLEDEGYQVAGAANGLEALRKVNEQVFDVLIVDVRMEGMSGLDAFAHMRQQGVELASLVITGYATEEDSIRAIRLGVGDYLRKPFEMRELLLRLARVTAVFQRQREGLRREQRLQKQNLWLQQRLFSPAAGRAGELAAHIGHCLQMEAVQLLELQLAAALAVQGGEVPEGVSPSGKTGGGEVPEGVPEGVAAALECWRENWDGSGPKGLAGEAIPLEGRIVRLAWLASQGSLEACSGQFDPHLRSTLDLRADADDMQRRRRVLTLVRGLLSSGQHQEALAALKEAESLADGPEGVEVQLLWARLEPAPLRRQRLEALVAAARQWGEAASLQVEAALLLLQAHNDLAGSWLKEALPRLKSEPLRALAELAMWWLGQRSADWSPESAVALLQRPEHEVRLHRCLDWLGAPLLRWWLQQGLQSQVLHRWARAYAGALVPSLLQLAPAQRQSLLQGLKRVPAPWLQALVQESDPRVRNQALQLMGGESSGEGPPPLHLRSFGQFQCSLAGQPVAERLFRGTRNKMLLAFVAQSPRAVPEERVVDLFWTDEVDKAQKGISNALFYIRKALRPEGWSGDCDYLVRSRDQLGLEMSLEPWHDLWEVERSLGRMRSLDLTGTVEEMERLLPLIESPYLDGCYLEWAVEKREQLELQIVEALLAGCQKACQGQAWEALADWAQQVLNRDGCHEQAAIYRIQALCELNRTREAQRTFEMVSRKLEQELEVEPSTELIQWSVKARFRP